MPDRPVSYPRFVANLKRLRERAGLSQAQLAEAAGLNRVYLARLESGAMSNPSLDTMDRLATALDVSVIDLLR
jgi:transcriptional regulator with XRE-family HTH domain